MLGSGTKQGYLFECRPSALTAEFLWMATARPTGEGTGTRYFATNHEGVTYYRLDQPFQLNDACRIAEGATPVGK